MEPQKDVFRLVLNFVLAPTRLLLVDTIAALEEGSRQPQDGDTGILQVESLASLLTWCHSPLVRTTVAFPLSASNITLSSCVLRSFNLFLCQVVLG